MKKNSIKTLKLSIEIDSNSHNIDLICINNIARIKTLNHYFLLKEYIEEWIEENDDNNQEYLPSQKYDKNYEQIQFKIDLKKTIKNVDLQVKNNIAIIKKPQDYILFKFYLEKWENNNENITQKILNQVLLEKFDCDELSQEILENGFSFIEKKIKEYSEDKILVKRLDNEIGCGEIKTGFVTGKKGKFGTVEDFCYGENSILFYFVKKIKKKNFIQRIKIL